jgi:tetratricopeptide (TPR) repeat protein
MIGLVAVCSNASAQKADKFLYKGNELYKKQEYDKSLEQYKQAITADPKNPIANFNQGNAYFRKQQMDEAMQSYDNLIANTEDKKAQQQAYYNKGVSLIKQNKLEESIEAWKNAVKLDPSDIEARENLQKALREKKKQDQQKQQQQKDKKDKKQENKDQQNKQQQPPPQSKLSKQRVEQLLKALQQKEKEVQDRLQKSKPSPRNPDKDW